MKILKYKNTLFILLFIIVIFIYKLQISIKYPPSSLHQWRQADALSMTKNYFEEGMNIFDPKLHFQGSVQGKAVGEFPGLYYLNACIWKITGENYLSFRLLNLIIVFIGLFSLFKLSFLILKDLFLALFIPFFIFSSPLFGYYSNNFLVNLPAVCLMFTGWYYFYRYHVEKSNKTILISVLLFSLAVLLRPTMLMGILPIYLLIFLEFVNILKNDIFIKSKYNILLLLTPIIVLVSWILISKTYNDNNGSYYFLTTFRPYWETINKLDVWKGFIKVVLPEFYNCYIILFILLFFLTIIVFWKKANRYLLILTVCIFFEIVAFILLWYNNLSVHDYYLIDFYLFIPILFITVFTFLQQGLSKLIESTIFKICLLLVLIFSFCFGTAKTRIKYFDQNTFVSRNFISNDENKFWDWQKWNYKNNFKAFETIRPFIRKIGIKRDDLVLSIPDLSPNITLYFMDVKGYSSLYNEARPFKVQIEESIKKGVKYLIINDHSIYSDTSISPYLRNKIGTFENIDFYSLKKKPC
jgi:hypothetical protein